MAQWKQYSGMWTRQQQMQAVSAATWPGILLGTFLFGGGRNNGGILGVGDVNNRSSPTQIGSSTNWSSLSGQLFVGATQTNGTAWGWGRNIYGQLGQNNVVYRSSPVQIGALTTWSKVGSASDTLYLINSSGALWSCGANIAGACGDGTVINRSSPVQVGSQTNWQSISGGNNFALAIKTNNTLWSWGYGADGQLGLNLVYDYRSSPTQVGSQTNWATVVCGTTSSFAIKTDGTLWSWGDNSYGQLGSSTLNISRSSPVQVGALTTWSSIDAKQYFWMAIRSDGTLWGCGRNTFGPLGINSTTNRSSPVQVGSLNTWSKVATQSNSTIALSSNGTLWSWGDNSYGQLLTNDVGYRSSPVQVGSLATWQNISSGLNASFATQSVYTT